MDGSDREAGKCSRSPGRFGRRAADTPSQRRIRRGILPLLRRNGRCIETHGRLFEQPAVDVEQSAFSFGRPTFSIVRTAFFSRRSAFFSRGTAFFGDRSSTKAGEFRRTTAAGGRRRPAARQRLPVSGESGRLNESNGRRSRESAVSCARRSSLSTKRSLADQGGLRTKDQRRLPKKKRGHRESSQRRQRRFDGPFPKVPPDSYGTRPRFFGCTLHSVNGGRPPRVLPRFRDRRRSAWRRPGSRSPPTRGTPRRPGRRRSPPPGPARR